MASDQAKEVALLRTELKNIRNQVRGMRAQHQKDMFKLKELLSKTKDSQFEFKNESAGIQNQGNRFLPIGFAETWHQSKNGTPRQGSVAKTAHGIVDISKLNSFHDKAENPEYSLQGLEQFSHVWIFFHFHENGEGSFSKMKVRCKAKKVFLGRQFVPFGHADEIQNCPSSFQVAPPRLKGKRVGLFSTRSPHRPNPIGLTLAKLDRIEGRKIFLQGLDLLDGTPILDIKPYIPEYDLPSTILTTAVSKDDCGDAALACDKQELKRVNELKQDEQVKVPNWITNSEDNLEVSFTPKG